jgi:hypothetical protein
MPEIAPLDIVLLALLLFLVGVVVGWATERYVRKDGE